MVFVEGLSPLGSIIPDRGVEASAQPVDALTWGARPLAQNVTRYASGANAHGCGFG